MISDRLRAKRAEMNREMDMRNVFHYFHLNCRNKHLQRLLNLNPFVTFSSRFFVRDSIIGYVGWSVCPSVGPLVRHSIDNVLPFRHSCFFVALLPLPKCLINFMTWTTLHQNKTKGIRTRALGALTGVLCAPLTIILRIMKNYQKLSKTI